MFGGGLFVVGVCFLLLGVRNFGDLLRGLSGCNVVGTVFVVWGGIGEVVFVVRASFLLFFLGGERGERNWGIGFGGRWG